VEFRKDILSQIGMPVLLSTLLMRFVGIVAHWREEKVLTVGKPHVKAEKGN
jgi:hypothetical protein